jgi:hypothetical protein
MREKNAVHKKIKVSNRTYNKQCILKSRDNWCYLSNQARKIKGGPYVRMETYLSLWMSKNLHVCISKKLITLVSFV